MVGVVIDHLPSIDEELGPSPKTTKGEGGEEGCAKEKRNRIEGRGRQTILDAGFCVSVWGCGLLTGRTKWLGNVGLATANARCMAPQN